MQCFTHPSLLEPPPAFETPAQRREKRRAARAAANETAVAEQVEKWDPKALVSGTEDAMKTLFVGRLAYTVTEAELRQEFEHYGPVRQVIIVKHKVTHQPRGYAFVEFEHSADLKDAYKSADGRKLGGRRVVVDVERGRTVKNWRPRRLGGGLGSTRVGSKDQNVRGMGRCVIPLVEHDA